MTPTWKSDCGRVELYLGDCLEVLPNLGPVHSIVTDPPYGLSFMGKRWDYDVPDVAVWAECLRVLKPGGHLLAFAGTRTQHRMACRIEDAGFEIRDLLAWVYGSGFPKSLDVSKAIDKAQGAERMSVMVPTKPGNRPEQAGSIALGATGMRDVSEPITLPARQWSGWGTALKPALEPITLARKPLDGTVAQNVLEHGTGAINVDGCRVKGGDTIAPVSGKGILAGSSDGWDRPWKNDPDAVAARQQRANAAIEKANTLGRWPANLIHDGSDEAVKAFSISDKISAARFFYSAKASKHDRDQGCEGLELKRTAKLAGSNNDKEELDPVSERFRTAPSRNNHPTVKPTDLMRYLCRLITPPGGIVLDPFMGSGSTGKAAAMEGFRFVGIERSEEYMEIAVARIKAALAEPKQLPEPELF